MASPTSLLAIIHLLSQPLTALRGSLELALVGDRSTAPHRIVQGTAEYRMALRESLAQADRLVGLLRSLRELAEAEEPSAEAVMVRLNELLAALVADVRPWADSLDLAITLDPLEEVCVRADAERLREALLRVLQKALERSSRGSSIRISLSQNAGSACLEVADHGPALNAEDLDPLEQPHSFGELFSEAARRGILEWAIAKRLLEALGATARVETGRGTGCCFLVSFPLMRA